MKVSTFLISLVLVGVVVGGLSYFFLGLSTAYGISYDSSEFAAYENMDNLKNISDEINTTIDTLNPTNALDLIGGFLQSGYQVLQFSKASFSTFTSMSEDAFDKLGNAAGGGNFDHMKIGIGIIVFVAFTFIIISVLVGKDV